VRRRSTLLIGLLILGLGVAAAVNADVLRGRFRIGKQSAVQVELGTWAALAAQPGIRTAVEMSSLADIQTGGNGTTNIIFPVHFSYDATKNAMKINYGASIGAPGIAWTKSLPYAQQFVAGEEMWFQFDVMWDAGMLTPSNGGNGIKIADIDEGNQSDGFVSGNCENGGTYPMYGGLVLHVQAANPPWVLPSMYHSCGGFTGFSDGLYTYNASGHTELQNKRPLCTFERVNAAIGDDCIRLLPDVWHTFTIRVKIGTWSANWNTRVPDSQIDIWVSRTGMTPALYLHSKKNYGLFNANPTTARFGKLWLYTFDWGRTSSSVEGNVWYRHVLFGSQPLKDPTSGLVLVPDGGTPPPDPYPSTLTASYLGVTGEDKVGEMNQTTPNGIHDLHISVAGLRSAPIRVRITHTGGPGTWETPFNGSNWIISATTTVPTANYWYEPYAVSQAHVKVWYADGSTDEVDATTPGPPPTFMLTVSKTGTGTVTSTSPSGAIACGGDCTESIASGSTITMTATPGTNYTFVGWSGGGCSGMGSCAVVLNADTTVTAVFQSTVGGGDLPGIANNGWLQITPALSSRYTPGGDFTCGGTMSTPDTPTSGAYGGTSSPNARSFSGITYGGGWLIYYGGGHGEAPGNDVERFDPFTKTWTQSWKPEVCLNICAPCGAVYTGSSASITTPLGRPFVEHMYQKSLWNPIAARFEFLTRGVGPWFYNPVDHGLTQIPLTPRTDGSGIYYPWSADVAQQGGLWSPELSSSLEFMMSGGTGVGVWRQNDTSATPPKWQIVGAIPAAATPGVPYSTYVTTRAQHFMLITSPAGGSGRPGSARLWYWFNAVTMTWTPVTLASGPDLANYAEYDTRNDRLILIRDETTPIKLWSCTPVATPVCTALTITAAVPSNETAKINDISAVSPPIQYDPIRNVFWYIHVEAFGQAIQLWAYRYAN
jgi:List-Bact-rpt repeat protein